MNLVVTLAAGAGAAGRRQGDRQTGNHEALRLGLRG